MSHRAAGITLAAAALVAGCSGAQSVQPFVPNYNRATKVAVHSPNVGPDAPRYQVLFYFGSDNADARYPAGRLINVNGVFYGTADGGSICADPTGCGTVFSITPTGTELVLHNFGGDGDGRIISGNTLLYDKGTLYGTTFQGGAYASGSVPGAGTVYKLSLSGDEKVLQSFSYAGTGPQGPLTALIDVDGALYGTTAGGGKYHDGNGGSYDYGGTVFRVRPTGDHLQVLHSFGSGTDGQNSFGRLLNVNGTLYGVTPAGGTANRKYDGDGTVFSISRSGTEKVLHSFGSDRHDGFSPYDESGLIDVNGKLYGTTLAGGKYGGGTVFSITLGGFERVLYSFGRPGDGNYPVGGLIDVNGTLYGTTSGGGKYAKATSSGGTTGGGTLFSISLNGKTEQILHNFGNGTDGQEPQGGLLYVNHTLYGTATWGGKYPAPYQSGSGGYPNCGIFFLPESPALVESGAAGDRYGDLDARAYPELVANVVDVMVGGTSGNVQYFGDFRVGLAGGNH